MFRAISLLMIIALQFPLLNQIRILLDFEVNRESISALFCVNKEEPITVCGGHCYLAKSLSESSRQDDAPPVRTQEFKSLILFLQSSTLQAPISVTSEDSTRPFSFSTLKERLKSFEIFHPPRMHDQIS